MEFLKISWEEVARLCEELGQKIEGYHPDVLIGISRGGLVPVRILSDILGIDAIGILGIKFYEKIGETKNFPEIVHEMPVNVAGKKVLIVDDVADTGKSLIAAREYILRKGAKDVKIATIHFKPQSILKPDYFAAVTTAWLIYPWERHEAERELHAL